jgi:hypothetical protein
MMIIDIDSTVFNLEPDNSVLSDGLFISNEIIDIDSNFDLKGNFLSTQIYVFYYTENNNLTYGPIVEMF